MTTLFNVAFEGNRLYDPGVTGPGFDGVHYVGGTAGLTTTMEVTAASKYSGTYGCEVTVCQGARMAGWKMVNNLTTFRQRFWFNKNTLSIVNTKVLKIGRSYHYDLSQYVYELGLINDGGAVKLFAKTYLAAGGSNGSGWYALGAGWNMIEMDFRSAVAGYVDFWLNGAHCEKVNGDNHGLVIRYPALGVVLGPADADTGAFYVDDWTANDTGASIGA